eukprot:274764_1
MAQLQHSPGELSQRVLQQTVMSKIGLGTDNVMMQYMLSFIAITILGVLTSRMGEWSKLFQIWLSKFLYPEVERPTIKFVMTQSKTGMLAGSLTGATTAVLAWMEQIALSVEKTEKNKSNITDKKDMILKLRGVGVSNMPVHYFSPNRKTTHHWLPDQTKKFKIDKNIWVIYTRKELQGKDGATSSVEENTIAIHTTKQLGLTYLLQYHNTVVDNYEKKLASKFQRKSHVFKFDSYDEKTQQLKWTVNEFSSQRKLKHLWFREKEVFVNAYKNFLYNKEDYDERGDPYTFSILLHGPPGCGKTSLLKSLISYDKMVRNITTHLFVVPFSKIESNEIFEKIMLDKMVNKTEISMEQRIYVFEDFDANDQSSVFNVRDALQGNVNFKDEKVHKKREEFEKIDEDKEEKKNEEIKSVDKKQDVEEDKNDVASALVTILEAASDKKKKKSSGNNSSLDLSDILNTLDGICERTGQRCIWTTNKSPPQKYFDPAFLRPGRMDMIIELGRCNYEGIDYLLRIYFKQFDEHGDEKYDIDDHINYNIKSIKLDLNGIDEDRFTPAQLKQICKESSSLKHAMNTMREICTPLKSVEEEMKEMDRVVSSDCSEKDLKRAISSPVFVLDELPEDIKRLPSGHWIEPQMKPIDQTKYIDTKALDIDTTDINNKDGNNDVTFVKPKVGSSN